MGQVRWRRLEVVIGLIAHRATVLLLLLLTPCTVLLRNYSMPPAGVGVADEGCGRGRLAWRLGADCNAPVYSCVSRRGSLLCVRVVDCSKL